MADKDGEEAQRINDLINKDYFATDQQRDWSNEDMRFCDIDGAMYDDFFEGQFDNRPKMEFNKVAQAVHRFTGEWASNRFDVKFIPDDGKSSEADANLLSGLYRKDFHRSNGPEAIDNAVSEMAKGGFSALKLSTEFVDEEDIDNEDQRVTFEPIFSAYSSVVFDSNAKRYDKSDAKRVTHLEQLTLKAAQAEWGDDVTSSFAPPDQNRFNWNNTTKIWIGHFYEIREEKTEAITFKDPLGKKLTMYTEDLKGFLDELADGGFEEVSRRKRKRKSVWKTVVSGSKILEKPARIPGKLLPIIPMYGFRSFVDGQEFWYGIVRKNKDANRLFSMSANSMAENAATTSKDMPIFTDEQVEGRETKLSEMHLGKFNYAVINQLYDQQGNLIPAGPVGAWAASRVDPNNAAVMQIAADYIREETGGAPQDVMDTEASGKAINAMISRVDMNTFVLMDNIAKTLKHMGKVYRSIAAEIYSKDRKVNLMELDGTEKSAQLFEIQVDEETGKSIAINDITSGAFEVMVDTGPAFASRRKDTMETLKDIMTATDPNSPYMPFLYSEIISNIDGVGLQGLKDFNSEQMLMQGLRKPETEEEAQKVQQAQAAQKDEQGQYLEALAAESNANAQESMSNIQKNQTQAGLNETKSAEIIAGIEISRFKAIAEVVDKQQDRQAQVPTLAFQR
jgi:hypothetical protein